MAPNHGQDALMACDELATLFRLLRPAAEYRTLIAVRAMARLLRGDRGLVQLSERLQVLAGIFLSTRKHQSWPGGAEALRAEIVDELLGEIRARLLALNDQDGCDQMPGDQGVRGTRPTTGYCGSL